MTTSSNEYKYRQLKHLKLTHQKHPREKTMPLISFSWKYYLLRKKEMKEDARKIIGEDREQNALQ